MALTLGLLGQERAAAGPSTFSLYVDVSSSGNGSIEKYDSFGNGTPFSSGFQFPEGLVTDSSGNFYLVDEFNDKLIKITPGGTASTLASVNDPAPYDVAIDSSGNLYVANYVHDTVTKYNSSGTPLATISGSMSQPNGLAIDSSGNLYVANLSGGVTVYNSSGQLTRTLPTTGAPQGMTFDTAGNLYVAYENTGVVEKFNSSGVDQGPFASGLGQATDLAFDPAGNLYVTEWGFSGSIEKLSSTGQDLGAFASNLSYPTGILIVAPEPSSSALLLVCGGLCGMRRRRRGRGMGRWGDGETLLSLIVVLGSSFFVPRAVCGVRCFVHL